MTVTVSLVLALLGVWLFAGALLSADTGGPGLAPVLLGVGAWLASGAAWAVMSLLVAFWYMVAIAGFVLLCLIPYALYQLLEPAGDFIGDHPRPFGFFAAGAGIGCLAMAVVCAVWGHPWWTLTALVGATALTCTAVLLLYEDWELRPKPRRKVSDDVPDPGRKPRRKAIAGAGAAIVIGGCGLALLVLGPLTALTTSGSVSLRVLGGVFYPLSGVAGAWFGGVMLGFVEDESTK
ncbi:hypothetical protein [Streptomyces sp. NPDC096132]|uniref:hypothetical protein n=1 Tax=Streptomyces sp. NPDC096132 TaxID=3366075 RepID=UPI003817D2F7